MTTRGETAFSEVHVRHVAEPMGTTRENGPHLADLRAFVAACEGLPDDVRVRIESGSLGESGRRIVTFSLTHRTPLPSGAGFPVSPGGGK